MRPDVTERIAVFDPLKGLRGNLERLFQIREAIQRFAEAPGEDIANALVVGIVTFVHVHGHDAVALLRQCDDLVRLISQEAHRLFGEHMRARLQRGENRRGV